MELKERVIRIVSAYFEKLSKKAVFLKQQNSYDLTMEQICNTDSCKDAVKVYCCDYAIYEMKDAYEPFLSWIRQAYYAEFADSYTVEEFVENCGVYSLQREVFCSYILSGVCERKLEVLMNEYDYEEEQTRESIYSSLRYIAGDKKLVLGIGKLHMAPLCVLRFLNMILDREDAIRFVFTYGETFLVKEYCQDEWQKLMQKAEENKLILALENSDIIQNFDVPDTFTYKEAEISSYINRLNNMVHFHAFQDAQYYFDMIHTYTELTQRLVMRISSSYLSFGAWCTLESVIIRIRCWSARKWCPCFPVILRSIGNIFITIFWQKLICSLQRLS